MGGTKAGGEKIRETNLRLYGPDYYRNIGRLGGAKKHPETRAFNTIPGLASRAGTAGGIKSRRQAKKAKDAQNNQD